VDLFVPVLVFVLGALAGVLYGRVAGYGVGALVGVFILVGGAILLVSMS
jgi:hypothetical protein